MTTSNLQANALSSADTVHQKCFVCEKEIVDGRWFCRIPRKEEPVVVLCSPRCALGYFESLHPITDLEELDRAAYERSLHFAVDGEMP